MKHRCSIRLLNSILVGLVAISAGAATGRPRLVVGIVVDQLRTDYLDYLRELFGKDGFRRLMEDGVYFKDLDFKVPDLDAVSGTAMMVTGAYPSQSGVTSALLFDPATMTQRAILGEAAKISPASISLSTISDEIAIDGIGLSGIYSIAPDPQQSVAMAGHAGNSAVWLDTRNGEWTGASYYPESIPSPAAARNRGKNALRARIDTMHWTPSRPLADYPGIPAQKRFYDFRYNYPRNDRDSYSRFAESPLMNREVTDLAIDYLNTLRLGAGADKIDMLNIGYTLAPYRHVKDGDPRIELEDAYLRLDHDLSRLLQAIEEKVGLENTLLYLLPTGHYDDAVVPDTKYRIPSGEFSTRRAESLLNSYLSAKYGQADYVAGFDGRQLYFSKEALRKASANQDMIMTDAADFLSRMSGISSAHTLREIISSEDPRLRNVRLGLDPRNSGDIIISILPGWVLCADNSYPQIKKPVRLNAVAYPGFILAPQVEKKIINQSVEAISIPPTLTQILRIRGPNGASARPLPLM